MKQLDKREYITRREQLMHHLEPHSIAVIAAAPSAVRNSDSDHPFRQDSDFYYLTGFNETNAVLVLKKDPLCCSSILFCQEKNPTKEIWEGAIVGQEKAVSEFNFDNAFSIDQLDEKLSELMQGSQTIYCALSSKNPLIPLLLELLDDLKKQVRKGIQKPTELKDINEPLHALRVIKSEAELDIIRHAGQISALAHKKAMEACRPEMYEFEIDAILRHQCMKNGAQYLAYNPIVASGANACVLHYTSNNCKIEDNTLVLIDFGCEIDCYASDITRTFPANGTFSAEQRIIYELVLTAQESVINMIKPGVLWNALHEKTIEIIASGLIDIGLLKGTLEECIANETYKEFFMHGTGHWLGLDVHDVGYYKKANQWITLEKGMVFTVEPGIYISKDNENIEARWRGIGVRIEDNVAVTSDGVEVLTQDVPKKPDAIEALMNGLS